MDTDAKLARLLDDLTARYRSGQFPSLEAIVAQYPDLADDLKSLWPAVMLAEELAKPTTLPKDASPTVNARQVGDYELLEELGRGGMGVVYKARQVSLNRVVALKMSLHREPVATGEKRFRAEAEVAARLDHPHIIPVYERGDWEGHPYFVMKYVEGETLARLVAKGPLPPRIAAEHMLHVAQAVHHAHQQGVLHRDLKPSNILIDHDGQPHVTDFGLAKRLEEGGSLTQSGDVLGTPSYMSPEQAGGKIHLLGPRSDVYSLGAILYHLLTGRPPFQAASLMDTLRLVLEQEPVPPRLLNPKVDRALAMICLKCLQKPPDLRYASAAQLADDLQAFLRGEPISAESWSLVHFVGRMLRPTHHAEVLENWGLLWMWHSLKILLLCAVTQWLAWRGEDRHWVYLALWSIGLVAWGAIFWALRRRAGPITFVERQIAHSWAAGVSASIALFVVEIALGLPVLRLSPLLAVFAGMVFLVKAGTLSGSFYFTAAMFFITALLMARLPEYGLLLFGVVSAASFFVPGLKYYRQRRRALRSAS